MIRDAEFSPCGRYRYSLERWWLLGRGHALWVLCNPSTADADRDDPTVRRLLHFSEQWGFSGLVVVNLFALRATNPRELRSSSDPIGRQNDAVIRRELCAGPTAVIAAWGSGFSWAGAEGRDKVVTEILTEAADVFCLGQTKDGHPRHPLYLRRDAELELWARTGGGARAVFLQGGLRRMPHPRRGGA